MYYLVPPIVITFGKHEVSKMKARKKEPRNVWAILKIFIYFFNLKNHHGNTIYQKNCFIFEIIFYIFKVVITKFSWKFTMFRESFYMFKTFKKSVWTCGFFVSKVFFPLSNVHQIISIFLWIYIFHKKGSMCSKHSKK